MFVEFTTAFPTLLEQLAHVTKNLWQKDHKQSRSSSMQAMPFEGPLPPFLRLEGEEEERESLESDSL